MGKNSISAHFARWDDLIRRGRGQRVRNELRDLRREKIDRSEMVRLANLAWRVDYASFGVRLLNPLVRPSSRRPFQCTPEEKTEYAVCLIKMGAQHEGRELLETVPAELVPRSLLFRAFALIAEWDYQAATPLLRQYTALPSLDDYQRLVGRLNLAEALIYEEAFAPAARELALAHRAVAGNPQYRLAQGKIAELFAQSAIRQRRWEEAERHLEQASGLLEAGEALSEFFIEKWRAIAAFCRDPRTPGPLLAVRKEAVARRHWETIRQVDRVRGEFARDRKWLERVYFGTPFDRYRAKLLQECPWLEPLPDYFDWGTPGKRLDLRAQALTEGSLKPGKLHHRLLSTLASDLYRPFRVATLHHALYAGSYFNPQSSPAQVHQAVNRLREWLKGSRLTLNIDESRGSYSLRLPARFQLRLPQPGSSPDREAVARLALDAFGSDLFSVREAARVWAVSPRTAFTLLENLRTRGEVLRQGGGRSTRYRVNAQKAHSA